MNHIFPMQFQDLPEGALFRLAGSDQLYRKQQDEFHNARQIGGTVARVMGHCETVIPYGEVSQGLLKEKSYNLFSQPQPEYTWGVTENKNTYSILRNGYVEMTIQVNDGMPSENRQRCLSALVESLNQAGK